MSGHSAISCPFPRTLVEAGLVQADALVSIGPSAANSHRVAVPQIAEGAFPRLLRLRFDDVPCPNWTDPRGTTWHGPAVADVEATLDLAREVFSLQPDAFIACHCEQGISRSAALALAILADRLGAGAEDEAVRQALLGDVEGRRCFNPRIVRISDRLLGRQGAIEAALERRCRPFVTWRRYWEAKATIDAT